MRDTPLYREAEDLYRALRQPGTGQISDAAEVDVSTDGKWAVFAGTLVEKLEGALATRICATDMETGNTSILTFGPKADRLPRFSPDDQFVGFLSDRHKSGDFQFYLMDGIGGAVRPTPHVQGWVEYFHWSPDGKRVLLGVAGHGADISGGQGAITSQQLSDGAASWMPAVDTGDEKHRWRRAWVYTLATNDVYQLATDGNVWEAVWSGNHALVAVVSSDPGEGSWYSAHLRKIDVSTGRSCQLHRPQYQVGSLSASPSGKHIAIVEALCSDRWIVAGELRLVDFASGKVQGVSTRGVDIAYTEWRSDQELLVAGHRGFDTVVGLYDVPADRFVEVWSGQEVTTGGRYVSVSGLGARGDCVLVGESYLRAPEIARISNGHYLPIKSFDLAYAAHAKFIDRVEHVSWIAADGLDIQGWLLRPAGNPPYALVMNVHGGPVWHWRPTWLGRPRSAVVLMLIRHGYAVFFPNPRGSGGRGQDFARSVVGDLGGADASDCLAGLDYLIANGIADPKRLGVTGISYGGYMSAWLVTHDTRFKAAVPVSPAINKTSQHLMCNMPEFHSLFLADSYTNPNGNYFARSPVMHAYRATTPTLNVCGALDRCTPPEEAKQFHKALLENRTKSMLVVYPEEGHGIHKFPAAIDYAARMVAWFEEHMGAGIKPADDEGCKSPTAKQ